MRKKSLLTILLLVPLLSSAAERSEQQMQQVALRVLNANVEHGNKAPRQSTALKLMKEMPKLSVYGYDDGGFAVVTNDDRFSEVIGYSNTEYCDTIMPCGFKWWLETANDVMENTGGQETVYTSIRNSKASVEPLLATKWGQENPFNAMLNYTINGVSYEFVTGCVATAMAQVMKYYEYPEKAQGSVSYIVWHYLARMEHTFGDYYDWNNMLDVYNYMEWGSMSMTTKAVATLMRDCGMAVEMNYGTASIGSGANSANIAPALKEHFSYSDKTALYKRSNYSKTDWMQMIYEELSKNRPIIYTGIDKNNEDNPLGHAFVLHGYNASGAVYVNWGWNGAFDGYYDIDLLNPDTYQFSEEQDMVFVVPVNEGNDDPDIPAYATNALNVNDVKLSVDGITPLDIELNNETTNLMGWQCDIELPEGLVLELKTNGKPVATLGERFVTTGHTISSNRLANGAYRFIATSMDGEAIPGTSGVLFTVVLKSNGTLKTNTTMTGKVTNIEYNTQDNHKLTFDDVFFTITVPNNDSGGGDGSTGNSLKLSDISLMPGESAPLSIDLENEATNLMGWQCDIVLPEGLTLALKNNGKPITVLGERFATTEHSISSSRLANGAYRFIATSIDGEAIPGTSGTLFTVTLQADASLARLQRLEASSTTQLQSLEASPTTQLQSLEASPTTQLQSLEASPTTLTGTVTNIEFNTQDNQKLTLDDMTFPIIILMPDVQKCTTPTITYDRGELIFACKTEGVTFKSEVKVSDAKTGDGSRIALTQTYVVSVYATKEGYDNSDVATATICWRNGRPKFDGFSSVTIDGKSDSDVNGDGKVDVADITTIISEIAAQARMQEEATE